MAEAQANVRSFVLADFLELAATFDDRYSYCGDSSHEPFNTYCCGYPDKALIVDEKLQRATLVHIINGCAYQSGYHMRGLGAGPWEKIQQAIMEQDGARAQAKKNSPYLGWPGVRHSKHLCCLSVY
jgi:hypothetical protein